MRTLLLLLLGMLPAAVGCTYLDGLIAPDPSSSPLPPVGDVVSFEGEAVGSIDDCAFDGICAVIVEVEGVEIDAIWAEGDGIIRCVGTLENNLAMGDRVAVTGVVRDPFAVSICPDESYSITKAE